MNRAIFVDTGAWKAFVDAKDQFHSVIREEFERCRRDRLRLETTDYVVSETLTLIRMRPGLGHHAALQFGKIIQESQVVHLAFIKEDIFYKAWEIFKRYTDKDFSFVNCTSFATMEVTGLKEALTLDSHFTQYGFLKIPA